jgi:hypothetical protein
MKTNWMRRSALVTVLLITAMPIFAHHGIAAYVADKEITVTGRVSEFDFTNPHAMVFVDVKEGDGMTMKWEGELTSPNILARVGWTRRTLEPGQQITISGHPAKNGEGSMWIRKIVKSDGKELPVGLGGE